MHKPRIGKFALLSLFPLVMENDSDLESTMAIPIPSNQLWTQMPITSFNAAVRAPGCVPRCKFRFHQGARCREVEGTRDKFPTAFQRVVVSDGPSQRLAFQPEAECRHGIPYQSNRACCSAAVLKARARGGLAATPFKCWVGQWQDLSPLGPKSAASGNLLYGCHRRGTPTHLPPVEAFSAWRHMKYLGRQLRLEALVPRPRIRGEA